MGAELDYDPSSDSAPRKKCIDRRRETSRYAARDRRGKEADVFVDLKEVVPLVEEATATHVDRIALLRVAATLCRIRKNANKFFEKSRSAFLRESGDVEEPEKNVGIWAENLLTECLDGFVLMAAADGTVLYITESVSIFLGLTQTDFIGHFIKDFIHQSDYDELNRAIIGANAGKENECGLVLRMKSVISPRGRNLNFKSALYKAVVCKCKFIVNAGSGGQITLIHGCSRPAGQGSPPDTTLNSSIAKVNESANGTYMTRHTCDMKFTYVSESLNYLLCHSAKSLMGTSFYDLVHPGDLLTLTNSMKELFRKGYCKTNFYRLLGSNSSVVWSQTEATTVSHTNKGQKRQYVLCVHSILGMQSEADFWCPLNSGLADGSLDIQTVNAQAAIAVKRNVKSEITDVAEYFGRQPEFIDCVDFTPLIDPIPVAAAMNLQFSSNQPVRQHIQRANYQDETDFAEPEACEQTLNSHSAQLEYLTDEDNYDAQQKQQQLEPRNHNSSYEEVLQWLFRDEEEEGLAMESAQPTKQYPVQEVGFLYQRKNGQSQPQQFQSQVCINSTAPRKGCDSQQAVQNSRGSGSLLAVPRPGSFALCNGSGGRRVYSVVSKEKSTRGVSHSNCAAESYSKEHQRAYSNIREQGNTNFNPSKEQTICNAGKIRSTKQVPHYSRYEQHIQHLTEFADNHQENVGLQARPQQHYGPPVSAIPERSSHPMPTDHVCSPSVQPTVPAANHQNAVDFQNSQQRLFPSVYNKPGVQPVAVVAPFNVSQLPTANTDNLHLSIYQQHQQQTKCNEVSKQSQYCAHKKQQEYGSSEYNRCQQEEDLSKSYKDCEQLGAQLAPFLPQEDMFELGDDISLLPIDLEGLFPEFNPDDFFSTSMLPQKIVNEFKQSTEVPAKKARLSNFFEDGQRDNSFLEDIF